jgi:L-ascorbate metabolism protein UlaG (beta-lactamase superfamily)
MQLPLFGGKVSGKRLEIMEKSPNYKDGQFHNLHNTLLMVDNKGMVDMMKKKFDEEKYELRPKDKIPSIKSDLKNISIDKDIAVWFGHSSYYIQIQGKRFLIDPVFSKHASPVPFIISPFEGTNIYSTDDMPQIDCILITHDHYDHLDYSTVKELQNKVKLVICGLGVGAHLERWGYPKEKIIEMDWGNSKEISKGFIVNATTSRHFSGRGIIRNSTLWLSFLLQTPSMNFFLSGDGGYDTHFAEIGKKFGRIDLAFLETGQYNDKWKFIHSSPEEVAIEAKDLNATRVLPIHWGKFSLADHPWKEPIERLSKISKKENIRLVTPIIGEIVDLRNENQVFTSWWENLK